jgi:hypothetical protein
MERVIGSSNKKCNIDQHATSTDRLRRRLSSTLAGYDDQAQWKESGKVLVGGFWRESIILQVFEYFSVSFFATMLKINTISWSIPYKT